MRRAKRLAARTKRWQHYDILRFRFQRRGDGLRDGKVERATLRADRPVATDLVCNGEKMPLALAAGETFTWEAKGR